MKSDISREEPHAEGVTCNSTNAKVISPDMSKSKWFEICLTSLLLVLISISLAGCSESIGNNGTESKSTTMSVIPEGFKDIKFGMTATEVDEKTNCTQFGDAPRMYYCDSNLVFFYSDIKNQIKDKSEAINYIIADTGNSGVDKYSGYLKYKKLLSEKYTFEMELTIDDGNLKSPSGNSAYRAISIYEKGRVSVGFETNGGFTLLHYANSKVANQIWNKYKNFKQDTLDEL